MPQVVFHILIAIVTIVGMEVVATLVHRHVMHGFGWGWHQSHHRRRTGWFEVNDLYAVIMAGVAIGLFAIAGGPGQWLWWVGLGMTLYGLLYTILHDGLVHRRFRFFRKPAGRYLRRLVEAHHLHHAVHTREGAVSFGFLYAPPVEKLRGLLSQKHGRQTIRQEDTAR